MELRVEPEPERQRPALMTGAHSAEGLIYAHSIAKSASPPRNRRRSLTQTMADSAVAAASATGSIRDLTQHAGSSAGTGLMRLGSRRRSAEDILAAEVTKHKQSSHCS